MTGEHPMERRFCGARVRGRPGGTCRLPPLLGTTRCKFHGGATPNAQRKAAETLAEWRLRRVAQLDRGLDVLMNDPEGKRLAALIAKQPGLVAKLLEVADRLRGGDGGAPGSAGNPIHVVMRDPSTAGDEES
jgi:hypothetical protein